MPILMSRDNISGYKLEELLATLIEEIQAKSEQLLQNSEHSGIKVTIINNNYQIIKSLTTASAFQYANLETMKKIGPYKGPSDPRF